MKREEAKDRFEMYFNISECSSIQSLYDFIDRIYNDFENYAEDECIVFSDERGYISEHGWAGKVKPNTKYKVLLVEEK